MNSGVSFVPVVCVRCVSSSYVHLVLNLCVLYTFCICAFCMHCIQSVLYAFCIRFVSARFACVVYRAFCMRFVCICICSIDACMYDALRFVVSSLWC
jgi:hypothetical protein